MATASGSGSSSQTKTAQKTWEMANQITPEEEIYKFDRNQHQSILSAKPWSKDPHFFKDIKISALALLKMVMHARYTHVNILPFILENWKTSVYFLTKAWLTKMIFFVFFRSGGNIEVMGLLLGKVDANVMVVMDCFALPVEHWL